MEERERGAGREREDNVIVLVAILQFSFEVTSDLLLKRLRQLSVLDFVVKMAVDND